MSQRHSLRLFRKSICPSRGNRIDSCRKRTEPLPAQRFSWIMPLLKSPDPYIIDHSGLVFPGTGNVDVRMDTFFFVTFVWWCLSLSSDVAWPSRFCSLSPVFSSHEFCLIVATGGGGQNGLDILGFSNIANPKARYYAPLFVGWLFLGTHPLFAATNGSLHFMVSDPRTLPLQEDPTRIPSSPRNRQQHRLKDNSPHRHPTGHSHRIQIERNFRLAGRKNLDQSRLQGIGRSRWRAQ